MYQEGNAPERDIVSECESTLRRRIIASTRRQRADFSMHTSYRLDLCVCLARILAAIPFRRERRAGST